MKTENTRRALALYLVLVFVFTWSVEIFVVCPHYGESTSSDPVTAALATGLVALCMFFPAVSVLLTRLILGDWSDCRLRLHLKGHVGSYLIGCFGPLVLILLGAGLWFALNPQEFMVNAPKMVPPASATVNWILLALLLVLAPLLNLVTCFGEEWGWRGFLMPLLCRRHSFAGAALITGVVWGLWHAPLIAVGHNYQKVWGEDSFWMVLAAIGAMVLFCIVTSFLFGFIAEKAKSTWPAVLAHGCLNGSAGFALMFTPAINNPTEVPYNPFVGPAPTGIIGGAFFIVAAVVIFFCMRGKKAMAEAS